MFKRRRNTDTRRAPSGPDPIAAALTAAESGPPLVARIEDVPPAVRQLRGWIEVEDADDVDGCNTVVYLDDEIHAYADPAEDGLDIALADQPGIDDVFAEDREVIYLRSRLALEDVHAAVIRAVVEVNRAPRPLPPSDHLSPEAVTPIAQAAADVLTEEGFVQHDAPSSARYAHRICTDGFVQIIDINPGIGTAGDGTVFDGTVCVRYGVFIPEAPRPPYATTTDPARLVPADCVLSDRTHVSPTAPAVADALRADAFPWLRGTAGRDALAEWVIEDPTRIFPPMQRPFYARLLAQWGHDQAAAAMLARLEHESYYLKVHSDAQQARQMLGMPELPLRQQEA